MLSARAQSQAYSNENLDVVTGTEGPPEWEAALLRRGTVCKATTIDGSGASDAHVRRWLYKRGLLRFMR
jgi:hypothetical protein